MGIGVFINEKVGYEVIGLDVIYKGFPVTTDVVGYCVFLSFREIVGEGVTGLDDECIGFPVMADGVGYCVVVTIGEDVGEEETGMGVIGLGEGCTEASLWVGKLVAGSDVIFTDATVLVGVVGYCVGFTLTGVGKDERGNEKVGTGDGLELLGFSVGVVVVVFLAE